MAISAVYLDEARFSNSNFFGLISRLKCQSIASYIKQTVPFSNSSNFTSTSDFQSSLMKSCKRAFSIELPRYSNMSFSISTELISSIKVLIDGDLLFNIPEKKQSLMVSLRFESWWAERAKIQLIFLSYRYSASQICNAIGLNSVDNVFTQLISVKIEFFCSFNLFFISSFFERHINGSCRIATAPLLHSIVW